MISQTFPRKNYANNSCQKSPPEVLRRGEKQKNSIKWGACSEINWVLKIPCSLYRYAHGGITALYCSISLTLERHGLNNVKCFLTTDHLEYKFWCSYTHVHTHTHTHTHTHAHTYRADSFTLECNYGKSMSMAAQICRSSLRLKHHWVVTKTMTNLRLAVDAVFALMAGEWDPLADVRGKPFYSVFLLPGQPR